MRWFAVLFLAAPLFAGSLTADQKVQHALDRLTFGPREGDAQQVQAMGLKSWIDQQLHPEHIPESPDLLVRLQSFPLLNELPAQLAMAAKQLRGTEDAAQRRRLNVEEQLAEAKILRAIYTTRQLQEVLTDFWYNHFNVFVNKGPDRFYVAAYERNTIRPHVLGKFHDLLLATAKDPAMLFYLDNWQSSVPKGRRGLNENYGRELLELHTLGVDGGYTQEDVTEVARCFTGWTIERPGEGGGFRYDDRMHDKGRKLVLGQVIKPGGGMNDGLQVLDILSHHPSTAHFISLQLAKRFVSDDPSPALVNRMAKTFLKKDGDLREVIKTMLKSPEFWAPDVVAAKVKSPLEIVASSVRALDADVTKPAALAREVRTLGEPLYAKLEPTGYGNVNAAWLDTGTVVERMNFATALAEHRFPGVSEPAVDVAEVNSPSFQRH